MPEVPTRRIITLMRKGEPFFYFAELSEKVDDVEEFFDALEDRFFELGAERNWTHAAVQATADMLDEWGISAAIGHVGRGWVLDAEEGPHDAVPVGRDIRGVSCYDVYLRDSTFLGTVVNEGAAGWSFVVPEGKERSLPGSHFPRTFPMPQFAAQVLLSRHIAKTVEEVEG